MNYILTSGNKYVTQKSLGTKYSLTDNKEFGLVFACSEDEIKRDKQYIENQMGIQLTIKEWK